MLSVLREYEETTAGEEKRRPSLGDRESYANPGIDGLSSWCKVRQMTKRGYGFQIEIGEKFISSRRRRLELCLCNTELDELASTHY
jgi:hypothetical protein